MRNGHRDMWLLTIIKAIGRWKNIIELKEFTDVLCCIEFLLLTFINSTLSGHLSAYQ